jgi:hypothetical protein
LASIAAPAGYLCATFCANLPGAMDRVAAEAEEFPANKTTDNNKKKYLLMSVFLSASEHTNITQVCQNLGDHAIDPPQCL